jgi:hypothetical protein
LLESSLSTSDIDGALIELHFGDEHTAVQSIAPSQIARGLLLVGAVIWLGLRRR